VGCDETERGSEWAMGERLLFQSFEGQKQIGIRGD
jgi:hypothetical protein